MLIDANSKQPNKKDGKVKESVEERLLEQGRLKQEKLELIKKISDPQATFKPILNKKSMKITSKQKQDDNNWGSEVKFGVDTPN